jgi:hypothetical protein
MVNRDFDRERRWRATENDNDWDWDYYYEYRYIPYSPYRRNDYDRNYYGRNNYDRDFYSRDLYSRDYDYGSRSSSQGRYVGMGPRGYRRSDERIEDDINDRLTWHGDIDATDIQVNVKDGIVTLTGSVDSRRAKRMAEDVAESVSGVLDVNNQLRVQKSGQYRSGNWSDRDVRVGMEVIGRDGEHVGEVKEVRANDFLVDRPMARDVYVPFSACQTTRGQIRLNVRADEVDQQNWEMPDLIETPTETSRKKR